MIYATKTGIKSSQTQRNRSTLIDLEQALSGWSEQTDRTTYFFDVRSLAEYERGHIPGFYWIESGQLVQEKEMYAPTRGARLVVVDDDGARANMSFVPRLQAHYQSYRKPLNTFSRQILRPFYILLPRS